MKIVIETKQELDPERTLNYIYQMCLEEPSLNKRDFEVSIEGYPKLKRRYKND